MKTGLARAAKLMRHFKHQNIDYFWDIEGITEDAGALQAVIDNLVDYCKDLKIDYVVGFDARGFLRNPLRDGRHYPPGGHGRNCPRRIHDAGLTLGRPVPRHHCVHRCHCSG